MEITLSTFRAAALGVDTAGVVEAVGKNVTHLAQGDEAFGVGKGAFAEYTVSRTSAPKPGNLTFAEAAALPVAGSTALQSVRDIGKVSAGQHVLVNGAGGGVGHLIVQIAKVFGAEVTATTTTDKLEFVRSLGADDVIDYTREDFRARDDRYNVIFEVGGELSFPSCRSVLASDGRLVFVGAGSGFGGPIGRFMIASFRSKVLKQPVVAFVSWESISDLMTLKDFAESEKIRPAIDRKYDLRETADAVRFVERGRVRGKVVITL